MAIKIPDDAKPARVPDLDLLVGLDAFYKRIVEGEKGIKEKIKATMGKARAKYAQSDRGVAELRGGGPGKGSVSAEKLYDLVDAKKGKKITLEQFLSAIKVESSKLTSFLSGDDIDALRGTGGRHDRAQPVPRAAARLHRRRRRRDRRAAQAHREQHQSRLNRFPPGLSTT
jgi:hypothetical protein